MFKLLQQLSADCSDGLINKLSLHLTGILTAEFPVQNQILDYDYEDTLRSFLFSPKQCPSGRFLSVIPGGNLGNLVWEYMSLYVIAELFGKKFQLKPYVNDEMKDTIETTFQRYTISEVGIYCYLLHFRMLSHLIIKITLFPF